MDEIFARHDLIDKATLKALSQRSDLHGWLQTLGHFGAIGLSGGALALTWPTLWAVPVFVLHGMLINYLYAGQHELSHATVFRTRWLNELFGRLIGFIVITPRDADQIQHFAHHRHTQIWRQDGELYRKPFTLGSYLLRLSGVEYWWSNVVTLVCYAAGVVREPYLADWKSRVIAEARWHLAGYALIAGVSVWAGSWAAMLFWLAPMLVTKALHQLVNTIEHVGLPHTANILENTRSTRTNGVMRWMAWQMPYHTAHHAFPSVPFFRLKQLHAALFTARGLEPPTMTYLGFQRAVIGALWRSGEADQPDDRVWVGEGLRKIG